MSGLSPTLCTYITVMAEPHLSMYLWMLIASKHSFGCLEFNSFKYQLYLNMRWYTSQVFFSVTALCKLTFIDDSSQYQRSSRSNSWDLGAVSGTSVWAFSFKWTSSSVLTRTKQQYGYPPVWGCAEYRCCGICRVNHNLPCILVAVWTLTLVPY